MLYKCSHLILKQSSLKLKPKFSIYNWAWSPKPKFSIDGRSWSPTSRFTVEPEVQALDLWLSLKPKPKVSIYDWAWSRSPRSRFMGEPEAEAQGLDLRVSLKPKFLIYQSNICSKLHLWSRVLGNDRKNEIMGTNSQTDFPSQGGFPGLQNWMPVTHSGLLIWIEEVVNVH